jgi:hypothetical protein
VTVKDPRLTDVTLLAVAAKRLLARRAAHLWPPEGWEQAEGMSQVLALVRYAAGIPEYQACPGDASLSGMAALLAEAEQWTAQQRTRSE